MDIFSKTVIRKHGRSFEKDQVIFSEGDPCKEWFIINEGNVVLFKQEQNENIRLSTLGPGDFIGEPGDKALTRDVSAVAATSCTLVAIDSDTFTRLINDNPPLAWKIMNRLSQRLRSMNQRLVRTMTKDDPARLAQALIQWANTRKDSESVDEEEIASLAGIHLSTAAALMRHLSNCDIFSPAEPGKWTLKDLDGLWDFDEYCIRKKQMDPLQIHELARLAGLRTEEARRLAIRVIEKRLATQLPDSKTKDLMTPLQRYLKLKLRFELHHSGIGENNLPQEMFT